MDVTDELFRLFWGFEMIFRVGVLRRLNVFKTVPDLSPTGNGNWPSPKNCSSVPDFWFATRYIFSVHVDSDGPP